MSKDEKKPPRRQHGTRYKARRRAVDILFEAEARDVDPVAIVKDRIELSQRGDQIVAPINPYTSQIVEGVAVELDTIDDVIAAHLASEWVLERIPAVDRAIMRMSVWELLYNADVPINTAVVEGVDLAAEYSAPNATPYINAVLDSIASKANAYRSGEALTEDAGLAAVDDAGLAPVDDALFAEDDASFENAADADSAATTDAAVSTDDAASVVAEQATAEPVEILEPTETGQAEQAAAHGSAEEQQTADAEATATVEQDGEA